MKVFIAIVVLGFPAALILAWAFDLTPEGLKRTKAAELADRALPEINEKSIAVLPFENLSEEAANAFFADGMQDEILTDLARIADLKVISRTSVMQYKTGAKRNLREIAGELGVAQTSYDARTIDNARQAIRLLEQAVAHDPRFYLAHCQLARAHDSLYFVGDDHTPARIAQAKRALEKALSLAPDRGEAHLAAAWISYHCHRDYQTALAELAIARRGLPNDSSIPELAGFIARRQGQWEQCIENLERAAELDPQNVWLLQQISQSYWFLRRYSEMA